MEATEIAKATVLLDGLILLGHTLRFSAYVDINTNEKEISSSNIAKSAALANSAHLSAKSAAIAYAAFKKLGSGNELVEINLESDIQKTMPTSKVIKLMNLIEGKGIEKIEKEKFEEVLDDMKDEFGKFGNIVSSIIITPKKEKLGAEAGSVFIEFLEVKSAENCMKGMKAKRYEGKEIKLAYIDLNVFKEYIL